jgi:hypothetical protein
LLSRKVLPHQHPRCGKTPFSRQKLLLVGWDSLIGKSCTRFSSRSRAASKGKSLATHNGVDLLHFSFFP